MNIALRHDLGTIYVQRQLSEKQKEELKDYMDLYPTYKVVYTNEF